MGLAASQARLLSITKRISDNELRAQIINNQKMRLATDSSKASERYINALNNAKLMFNNYDENNAAQKTSLTYNALTKYNPYNNQYCLTDASGAVLLKEEDIAAYNLAQRGNGVDDFLKAHGIEWTTSYWDTISSTNSTFIVEDSILASLREEYNALNDSDLLNLVSTGQFNYYPYWEGINGFNMLDYLNLNNNNVEETNRYNELCNDFVDNLFNTLFDPNNGTNNLNNKIFNSIWDNMVLSNNIADLIGANYVNGQVGNDGTTGGSRIIEQPFYADSKFYRQIFEHYFTEPTDATETKFVDSLNAIAGDASTGLIGYFNNNYTLPCGQVELLSDWFGTSNINSMFERIGSDLFMKTQYSTDASSIRYIYNEDVQYGIEDWTNFSSNEPLYIKIGGNNNDLYMLYDYTDSGNRSREYYPINSSNSVYPSGVTNVSATNYNDQFFQYTFNNTSWFIPLGNYTDSYNTELQDAAGNITKFYSGNPYTMDSLTDLIEQTYFDNVKELFKEWVINHEFKSDVTNNQIRQIFGNNITNEEIALLRKSQNTIATSIDLETAKANLLASIQNSYCYDMARYFSNSGTGGTITPGSGTSELAISLRSIGWYKDDTKAFFQNDSNLISMINALKNVTADELRTKQLSDANAQYFSFDNAGNLVYTAAGEAVRYTYRTTNASYMDADGNTVNNPPCLDENGNQVYDELTGDPIYLQTSTTSKGQCTIPVSGQYIADINSLADLFDAFGTPVYGYMKQDASGNWVDAQTEANWWINIYNKVAKSGYHMLEKGLASSSEWIQYALENGIAMVEQLDSNKLWKPITYTSCADITEQTDTTAVAIAEAEYNKAMKQIESKDKIFDMELKNIDTEHTSLKTEYDSVKKAMEGNISRTFQMYS